MWIKVNSPDWLKNPRLQQAMRKLKTPHVVMVVTGKMSSGKDTVANRLGCVTYNLSTPLRLMAKVLYGVDKTDPEGRILIQHLGDIMRGRYGKSVAEEHVAQCRSRVPKHTAPDIWHIIAWEEAGKPDFLARCAWWYYQTYFRAFPEPKVAFAALGARLPEEVESLRRAGAVWVHVERPESERLEYLKQIYDGTLEQILSHNTETAELDIERGRAIKVWNSSTGIPAPAGYIEPDALVPALVDYVTSVSN